MDDPVEKLGHDECGESGEGAGEIDELRVEAVFACAENGDFYAG